MKTSKLQAVIAVAVAVITTFTTWQIAGAATSYARWRVNSATYYWGLYLPSDMKAPSRNAANGWTNVTTSSWTFREQSGSNNRIEYRWIDGSGGTAASNAAGLDSGGYIVQFSITYDSGDKWYTGTGTPASDQWDAWSVGAQEYGHALGLDHSQTWNCPDGSGKYATMCHGYSTGQTYFRSLESDDRLGVGSLYP